ncbi:sulfatase-like hydrolase/transferase [Pseudodonghicola flavimaris]|uniref:Sulfatase-like hydrolase/transferase n=1 Tax=Pseudodonghicola flavimaris TaxID=3050036 RepID=A0ABT7EUN1_9RHOB|nr:sulfatase-like hydrolase/transferase [Pseudodonghicola flavimaris]MDK3016052.1 sulfatase-like hydrolase/transferase [Pseudodonghicola flavimaris]
MTARRNLLFVVIDQFRADCLHGALADHVELPNLRSLMGDAVSFRRHYSVTNPCGPSRASILTGQYAMNHRAVRNGTPLPADTPTLATELRRGGYRPLLYGYTDSSVDPRGRDPRDPALASYEEVMTGFDEALEMRLEESWPWRAHLAARGYQVPEGAEIFRPLGDRPDDPALYRAEDSDTAFLTDRVLAELAVRPAGWCAHVTYIRPHPPLVAPAPYNRMYDPASLPPAATVSGAAGDHPINAPARAAQAIARNVVGFPDLQPTAEAVAMLRAIYLGLATEVDHHIGRILTQLKQSGQYDETLLIVTADHGELLGDYGLWGKMTYHEAAYHVPLIVRDPDHPQGFGTAVTLATESTDVAPTILDLLGIDIPDTMDGRSLAPFLDGATPEGWRDSSYSELDFGDPLRPTPGQQALGLGADRANLCILRHGRYTLVHLNGGLPPLLFDRDGAGEAENIAARPEAQPLLLEMTRGLLDHRMAHAQGRFAWTMITPDGPRRATRHHR